MLQAWQVEQEDVEQHTPLTQALLAHSAAVVQFCPFGRPTQVLLVGSQTGLVAGQGFVPLAQQLGSAEGMQALPHA
jgi:hypothetical protein